MKILSKAAKNWSGWVLAAAVSMPLLYGCGGPELATDLQGLRPVPGSQAPAGDEGTPMTPTGTSWSELGKPVLKKEKQQGFKKKRLEIKVYFAFDRSSIGTSQRPKLERLSKYLKRHSSYSLVIEGHTDKRGSTEYNRALSQRRALSVKQYLVDLGINADRLQTVGYGEEKPAVPDASTEREYSKNRRAEFIMKADSS